MTFPTYKALLLTDLDKNISNELSTYIVESIAQNETEDTFVSRKDLEVEIVAIGNEINDDELDGQDEESRLLIQGQLQWLVNQMKKQQIRYILINSPED